MTEAYKAVLGTEEEAMLEELLLKYINKSDSTACCVALRLTIGYLDTFINNWSHTSDF